MLDSRTIGPARLPLGWLPLALALSGCLPEPSPYDPCAVGKTQWFTMPPRGCNGHEVKTLWEQRDVPPQAQSRLLLDEQGAYWVDGLGHVFYTDGGRDGVRTVFETQSPNVSVVGIDLTVRRLYLLLLGVDATTMRQSSSLVGVDLNNGESRTLVDLVDISAATMDIVGDRFFVTTAGNTGMLVGPIDWDATASTRQLSSCVSPETNATEYVFSGETVYYVTYTEESKLRVNGTSVATCEPTFSASFESTSGAELLTADGELYMQECNYPDCELFHVAADGTRSSLLRGYLSWQERPIVDGGQIYTSGTLPTDLGGTPRLYAWDVDGNPEVIAAPTGGYFQAAINSEFVFALQSLSDVENGVFDEPNPKPGQSQQQANAVSRLMRIRR